MIQAAHGEIASGTALLPAVAVAELITGESTIEGAAELSRKLSLVPSVLLSEEAAASAGSMGAFLRAAGRPIPFPDLLIAATALWIDVLLLAWDGDYAGSIETARKSASSHPGAELWGQLQLHPASLGA